MASKLHTDSLSIIMKFPRRMAIISSIIFFNILFDIKLGLSLHPTFILFKLSLHFYIVQMYNNFPDLWGTSKFSSFIEWSILTFFINASGFWLLRITMLEGPLFQILSIKFLIFYDSDSKSLLGVRLSITFKIYIRQGIKEIQFFNLIL